MKNFKYAVLCLIAFLSFGNINASAIEGVPFKANLILPSGQDKGVEDYVSLTAKTGKINEELEFEIVNNEKKSKTIKVEVVDSYASPTGTVQYSSTPPENSSITDKNYKMQNYILLKDNKVTLKPKEKKRVKMQLSAENLDGVILGGISFKEDDSKKEESNKSGEFKIESKLNIVIGIKMNFGTKQLVNLKAGNPSVQSMPAQYIVNLPMELTSNSPKKFDLKYSISDKEELFKNQMSIEFPAKSKASIRIPWEYEKIENGKTYTLKGTLTYKDIDGKTKEMNILKEFEYNKEISAISGVTNKFISPVEEVAKNYYFSIPVLFLGIGATIFLIMRRKKKYYYFSEERTPKKFILENSLLENSLTEYKSIPEKFRKSQVVYRHTYHREGKNDGDYELIKTKEIRNK